MESMETTWDPAAARSAATPHEVIEVSQRILIIDEMVGNHGGVATAWREGLGHGGYNPEFEPARYEINRCLRLRMATDPENTWELRWSVVDTGSEGEWLDLLDMKVIPEMIKRGMIPAA